MQFEAHERARLLLDQAAAEGISAEEHRWVNGHVGECAECSAYAELTQRAVRALDGFAFDLDPAAALRVQDAVQRYAEQLASIEAQRREYAVGVLVAIVLTVAGSVAMWQPAAWLAERWNVAPRILQIGFAIFWLLPSVLLDVALLFRGKSIGDQSRGAGATR